MNRVSVTSVTVGVDEVHIIHYKSLSVCGGGQSMAVLNRGGLQAAVYTPEWLLSGVECRLVIISLQK